MLALMETQNILFRGLTKTGGRSGRVDGGKNTPFPGVTQRTCCGNKVCPNGFHLFATWKGECSWNTRWFFPLHTIGK